MVRWFRSLWGWFLATLFGVTSVQVQASETPHWTAVVGARYRLRLLVSRAPELVSTGLIRSALEEIGFSDVAVYLDASALPPDWIASGAGSAIPPTWLAWAEATWSGPDTTSVPTWVGWFTIARSDVRGAAAPAPVAPVGEPRVAASTRPEPVHTAGTPWSFYEALVSMASRHGWRAIGPLSVMWSESNLVPSAGHHAVGLIQIEPDELPGLGWNRGPDAFKALSAVDQLPYVERYYAREPLPPDPSPAAFYLANFLPAFLAHGNDPHFVLTRAGDGTGWYEPNAAAFDPEKKGWIEVGDLQRRLDRVASGPTWLEHVARLKWVEEEQGVGVSVGAIAVAVTGFAILVAGVAYWAYVQA